MAERKMHCVYIVHNDTDGLCWIDSIDEPARRFDILTRYSARALTMPWRSEPMNYHSAREKVNTAYSRLSGQRTRETSNPWFECSVDEALAALGARVERPALAGIDDRVRVDFKGVKKKGLRA